MGLSLRNKDQSFFIGSAVFFFIASSIIRYLALAQTPYANGWDGYYYVMQAHSWLTYGHLQSLDYSLIYPYFTVISYLVGDYELAYKIGASLLSGGLVASSTMLVYLIRKKNIVAVLAGSFLLFSPTTTFMITQFPKNVLGLIVLNLFLGSIYKKKYLYAFLFFLISIFTHRMITGICLLIILLYVVKQVNIKWIIGGIVLLIILSLLPGTIHFSDFSRFSGQLNWVPQFSPLSFYKLFENNVSFWWVLELALLSLITIYLIYNYFKKEDFRSENPFFSIIIPMILLLSVFPFFIMAFGSMGYRFFMIAPLIITIYFASKINVHRITSLGSSFALAAASMLSYTSYNPAVHDPPNKLYEVVIARLTDQYTPQNYPLVIVHKSLAELIIYKTKFDALNWAPPKTSNIDEVLRIVHNIEFYHFSKYLDEKDLEKIQKLTLHYYATTETSWQKFMRLVEENEDTELLDLIKKGNNPLEQRPYYLKKGKDL